MNKFKLEAESLKVESFDTIAISADARGTVAPGGCVCFAPPCICSAIPEECTREQ